MRYRRDETFRYQFEVPIPCEFRVVKIDHVEKKSKVGTASIIDISQRGLKIATLLNIPFEKKIVEIEITFTLNSTPLIVIGELLWKKESAKNYTYGVKLTIDQSLQKELVEELKIYSKGIAVIKKKE